MKRIFKTIVIAICLSVSGFAQKPEPTVAELQLIIKEQRAQIADLNMKLIQVQSQLLQMIGQAAQQEQQAAQADLKAEHDKTAKQEPKK